MGRIGLGARRSIRTSADRAIATPSNNQPIGWPNDCRPISNVTVTKVSIPAPAKSMLGRPGATRAVAPDNPTIAAATNPGTMFGKNTLPGDLVHDETANQGANDGADPRRCWDDLDVVIIDGTSWTW